MSTVVITKAASGRHTIQFRYDPALVDLIKQTVPGHMRSFDPQTKVWSVENAWLKVFTDAAAAAGHKVNIVEPPRPQLPPAPPPPPPVDSWAVTLLTLCGTAELREKVFRALAKCLHADLAGGNGELMQQLNDARDELNKKGQKGSFWSA